MTTSIYQSSTLEKRKNTWKRKAQLKHNFFYYYPFMDDYVNNRTYIKILCPIHGSFKMTPGAHVNGRRCRSCWKENIKNTHGKSRDTFVNESIKLHNEKYDYSDVVYINDKTYVKILCPIHGSFKVTPNNHLQKQSGCPKCNSRRYSKIAIEWLNSLNLPIQHEGNDGEFRITKSDGTYYFIDGYNKETNTVYEFHGDAWHGNPEKYQPEDNCHPFDRNITAKELYDKTIEREDEIKSLDYNLVVIWEKDYKILRSIH